MPATAREPSAELSTHLPIGRQHRLLRARTCTPGNGPDHALRDGTEMMDQQGTALHRWRIAVAGLFLQMALGAVYAWSVFRTLYGLMLTAWGFASAFGPLLIAEMRQASGVYGGALHVIAGVMGVCTLLPMGLFPPNGDRGHVSMRVPVAARQ